MAAGVVGRRVSVALTQNGPSGDHSERVGAVRRDGRDALFDRLGAWDAPVGVYGDVDGGWSIVLHPPRGSF